MFGAPNLSQSIKNFTQPLVVMVETFKMSGPDLRVQHRHNVNQKQFAFSLWI